MQVMGTNKWETDVPKKAMIKMALKFAETLKEKGIAELRYACIADEQKLLWCAWDTENLEALQAAFSEMNQQSGLVSELTIVETMFPE